MPFERGGSLYSREKSLEEQGWRWETSEKAREYGGLNKGSGQGDVEEEGEQRTCRRQK